MDEGRAGLQLCHNALSSSPRCGIMTRPNRLQKTPGQGRNKRTSAAKAVKLAAFCGTAEAVPFVR
jgi:hypothetical protein